MTDIESMSGRSEVGTWETEPADENAPLNRETLCDFYFYILNPRETSHWSWELWVEHDGGIEFPVMRRGSVDEINSSSTAFGWGDRISPSDDFEETLVDVLCDASLGMYPLTSMTVYPDHMPQQEMWAIQTIMDCVLRLRVPYEIDWIIEQCCEEVSDE